jgi:hypothetical protein
LAAGIVDCVEFLMDPDTKRPTVSQSFPFFEPAVTVPDAGNPARWFVGLPFGMRYGALGLLGVMVYFRPDGTLDRANVTLLQQLVAVYTADMALVGALRHHGLAFASRQENDHRLRLQVCWLTQDDRVLAHTGTATYADLGPGVHLRDVRAETGLLRLDTSCGQLVLDPGSLRRCPDGFALDVRPRPTPTEVALPPEFGDGYPLACAACLKPTLRAVFGTRGLGASCCPGCAVWFSRDSGSWTCCAPLFPNVLCDTVISDSAPLKYSVPLTCPRTSRHAKYLVLQASLGEVGLRYPFRQHACLSMITAKASAADMIPRRKRGRPRKGTTQKHK